MRSRFLTGRFLVARVDIGTCMRSEPMDAECLPSRLLLQLMRRKCDCRAFFCGCGGSAAGNMVGMDCCRGGETKRPAVRTSGRAAE